uniref:Ovule protein n=1 Tax=Steinernema glaseri TaxID=37863 RepID=A0A1I7YJZ6_9BILA
MESDEMTNNNLVRNRTFSVITVVNGNEHESHKAVPLMVHALTTYTLRGSFFSLMSPMVRCHAKDGHVPTDISPILH